MPNPAELPPHVRRLVDEIESEIGETDVAVDEISGDTGRTRVDGAAAHDANGRVEAAVRQILTEIGEDPDRQGLSGRPSASTGCTPS